MPKRAVYAVLAWGAATATAMAVVWAGLDSVLPAAFEGPHVATVAAWPVQGATTGIGSAEATSAPPAATAVAAVPSQSPSTHASSASPSRPTPSGSPAAAGSGPSQSPTPSGTQKRYSTPGGTAVLTLYAHSAVLDAATPADGYSASSWTNSDFLEVEFAPDGGGTVYEVIATWNGTSPQVQTVAVGG